MIKNLISYDMFLFKIKYTKEKKEEKEKKRKKEINKIINQFELQFLEKSF